MEILLNGNRIQAERIGVLEMTPAIEDSTLEQTIAFELPTRVVLAFLAGPFEEVRESIQGDLDRYGIEPDQPLEQSILLAEDVQAWLERSPGLLSDLMRDYLWMDFLYATLDGVKEQRAEDYLVYRFISAAVDNVTFRVNGTVIPSGGADSTLPSQC